MLPYLGNYNNVAMNIGGACLFSEIFDQIYSNVLISVFRVPFFPNQDLGLGKTGLLKLRIQLS